MSIRLVLGLLQGLFFIKLSGLSHQNPEDLLQYLLYVSVRIINGVVIVKFPARDLGCLISWKLRAYDLLVLPRHILAVQRAILGNNAILRPKNHGLQSKSN